MPAAVIITKCAVVLAANVLPIVNNWCARGASRQSSIRHSAINCRCIVHGGLAVYYRPVSTITSRNLCVGRSRRIRIGYLRILTCGSRVHVRSTPVNSSSSSIGLRVSCYRRPLFISERSSVCMPHVIPGLNSYVTAASAWASCEISWSSLNWSLRKVSLGWHRRRMIHRWTPHCMAAAPSS